MDQLINTACDHFVPTLIAGSILVGIALKSILQIATTASRERSRREIAAYIAEGSISPEQGERLLRADVNRGRHGLG